EGDDRWYQRRRFPGRLDTPSTVDLPRHDRSTGERVVRVLVCGGRDYGDRKRVFDVLDWLRGKYGRLNVIQGGARGSDALAREWASCQTSAHLSNFPADWEKYGKAAGAIRNQQMLIEGKPDLVIAF